MKKVFAMMLAAAMSLSLVACGGGSQPASSNPPAASNPPAQSSTPTPAPSKPGNDKLVVGFAQIGQESGWRDAETNDVQWYAARNTDTVELHFADAQQKQENQIKAIRSFIEMGVDVIAFPPVVETGWEAVLTECQEAGIPVILVDRGIDANTDDSLYTTMIASDHVWAGEQAAIAMNDLLGGSGVVVELEGTVGASAAVQRKQGFDEYMAANCSGIEIVASQTGDFTRAQGKEVRPPRGRCCCQVPLGHPSPRSYPSRILWPMSPRLCARTSNSSRSRYFSPMASRRAWNFLARSVTSRMAACSLAMSSAANSASTSSTVISPAAIFWQNSMAPSRWKYLRPPVLTRNSPLTYTATELAGAQVFSSSRSLKM